jgi:hypothetical protein
MCVCLHHKCVCEKWVSMCINIWKWLCVRMKKCVWMNENVRERAYVCVCIKKSMCEWKSVCVIHTWKVYVGLGEVCECVQKMRVCVWKVGVCEKCLFVCVCVCACVFVFVWKVFTCSLSFTPCTHAHFYPLMSTLFSNTHTHTSILTHTNKHTLTYTQFSKTHAHVHIIYTHTRTHLLCTHIHSWMPDTKLISPQNS